MHEALQVVQGVWEACSSLQGNKFSAVWLHPPAVQPCPKNPRLMHVYLL